MGFWHTGYMEFHEPVGLDTNYKPSPPTRFPCPICGLEFSDPDDIPQHCFEAHPRRRPVLFVRGAEVGSQPLRIVTPLKAGDVRTEHSTRARLNGSAIRVSQLGTRLSGVTYDVCKLTLEKDGVEASFRLEIMVASDQDLRGVEEEFLRMARNRRLDVRAVEEFIGAAAQYKTALGYTDGICAYLYGTLARERSADTNLQYEAYISRFTKAVEQVSPYKRRLARTIAGLIEFHFNHFESAVDIGLDTRVGAAASKFAHWMAGRKDAQTPVVDPKLAEIEGLVTDMDTHRLIQWTLELVVSAESKIRDMEAFLERSLSEFDRVKARILLAETCFSAGDAAAALRHAKALRNIAALETWAERLIRAAEGRA
jgi:hypothetical protein